LVSARAPKAAKRAESNPDFLSSPTHDALG
jgi:hypothetical protein